MSDRENSKKHEVFMAEAINEAISAYTEGEVPIGAIAVRNNEIIEREHNRVEQLKDCTAHAEMLLLKKLFIKTGGWRLNGISLYVTLEPCMMCAGAMQLARIDSLVFGAFNERKGAVSTLSKILDDPYLNHKIKIVEYVRGMDSSKLLRKFFDERRVENY